MATKQKRSPAKPATTTTPTKTPARSTSTSRSIEPVTTVPGMSKGDSRSTIEMLQQRLVSLLDLQLTLKHIHWNVVGMNFISVHEMLDPQHAAVQAMTDEMAERIATLGGEPLGTPGAITSARTWNDYSLNREPTVRHLAALDAVYSGVIEDHRAVESKMADLDPVTDDLLIGQLRQLEQFQWFVRAHLKDSAGDVVFRRAAS